MRCESDSGFDGSQSREGEGSQQEQSQWTQALNLGLAPKRDGDSFPHKGLRRNARFLFFIPLFVGTFLYPLRLPHCNLIACPHTGQ